MASTTNDEAQFWSNRNYFGWIIGKTLQLSSLSQRELARHNLERIKEVDS